MSTRLVRIVRIDQQIREEGYPSAASLAAQLEVSERTIYADRDFLINSLGAPIAYDDVAGGWYYTDRTWILPAILVSEGELLAFFPGSPAVRPVPGHPV